MVLVVFGGGGYGGVGDDGKGDDGGGGDEYDGDYDDYDGGDGGGGILGTRQLSKSKDVHGWVIENGLSKKVKYTPPCSIPSVSYFAAKWDTVPRGTGRESRFIELTFLAGLFPWPVYCSRFPVRDRGRPGLYIPLPRSSPGFPRHWPCTWSLFVCQNE